MLHKISVLVFVLLAVACVKVQKKGDTEKAAEAAPAPAPQAQASLAAEVNEGFDFNYDFSQGAQQVRFNIPAEWEQPVVVEKSIQTEKIFQREILLGSQHWTDLISENIKVNYKFYKNSGSGLVLLKEVEIIPALDLNLTSDFDLYNQYALNPKVKKIYIRSLSMTNEAKILIGDYSGQIVIENLNSDQGTLQTFAESVRAISGDGRSVGGFKLDVQSGTGSLKINLFAESGANGAPGLPPDESKRGVAGTAGEPAAFESRITNCSGSDLCFPVKLYTCTTAPKEGGDGHRGSQGYPGKDGKNGGSVKKVSVSNRTSTLQIETFAIPGQKGFGTEGGAGGEGGERGLGGDGALGDLRRRLGISPNDPPNFFGLGSNNIEKACAAAPNGLAGGLGIQGSSGIDGKDGQVF